MTFEFYGTSHARGTVRRALACSQYCPLSLWLPLSPLTGEGADVYGSAVGTFSTYSIDSQPAYQISDTSGNGHLFGLAGLTKGWHTLVVTLAYNGASSGEVAKLSITRVEFDAGQRGCVCILERNIV